jgi:peptidoglycan/LPS O-acetylase OafA/YrhL
MEAGAQEPKERRPLHMPELDGIRGIAVLMVLAMHCFALPMEPERWKGLPRVIELLTLPGGTGVDMFFVLSGFLITGILLDASGKPHYIRNFYGRRALRILPLYYLILLLIFLLYPKSGNFVFLSVFYLSNMVTLFGVAILYAPLWSLSVEEHFYLLWPWVVRRLSPQRLALVAIAIVVAEPIVRGIGFELGLVQSGYSWNRFDGIATGAFLAAFVRFEGYTRSRLLRFSAGALAAGIALVGGGIPLGILTRTRLLGATLQFTFCNLLYVGLIGIVLSGTIPPLTALMRSRPLRWCGDLSYCLYIIHWLILDTWNLLFGKYPLLLLAHFGRFGTLCIRAGIVCAVCFLIAELSHRYFEGPILKFKRVFA